MPVTPNAPAHPTDQWDFTARFEGVCNWLYKDTSDVITCGVGFACRSKADLRVMPWTGGLAAAEADYLVVAGMPSGRPASFYKPSTHARLPLAFMHTFFEQRVTAFRAAMQADGWRLQNVPLGGQIALVDMAYNLGVAGLGKYRNLRAAVVARDWGRCAVECSRRGVSQARNDATRALFVSLA